MVEGGIILPTLAKRVGRKAKKSYTLSPESIAFFETIRKPRRAASMSSVLEEILQTVRRQEERAKIAKSVDAYYSSLSDQQAAELVEWGHFATSEFLREQLVPSTRSPLRGEIWFAQLPSDPPEKGRRPVVVVSPVVILHRWMRGIVMNGPTRFWLCP
jgi:hypothetical protein